MIGKTLNYISHHAIAILALVCSLLALAGASYAATQLPKNSVGNPQIKQGAVSPPKFSTQIGGYVRMYAKISASGKLLSSSPQATLTNWGLSTSNGPSAGVINWKSTVPSRCAVLATAQGGTGATPASGSLIPDKHGSTGTHVFVQFDGVVSVAAAVVC